MKELFDSVPVDPEAEERAWQVVRAAYAERVPNRRSRRWPVVAVALAAVVAAAALSPPGRAVVTAVRRSIGIEHAAPALFRLPAPGRLLVSGRGGTWVVSADGSKRRLGSWTEAAWSPHGLYVAAASRDELAAVEPATGNVHWTLARPGVRFPRWGGSRVDTRVAYLSGRVLHVVGGNGRGDRVIGRAALVAPAWQPGDRLVLAYVDAAGRLHIGDGFVSRPYASPRALAWSLDGSQLALATAKHVVVFVRGAVSHTWPTAGVRAIAFSPGGRVAVARGGSVRYQGEVLFGSRGLLAGLAWSPGGRWFVTSIPGADQLVFVGPRRVIAVSNIARQFGGAAPQLDGWMPGP